MTHPMTRLALGAIALALLAGCPTTEPAEDDAGDTTLDAGEDASGDAGQDTSTDPGDAVTQDAGEDAGADVGADVDADVGEDAGADTGADAGADVRPAPGFGAISGDCDLLDEQLTAAGPSILRNAIDFGEDAYDEGDKPRLTMGGRKIIDDGNAGGSSILSEVISFELLARCEGATLLKTETEILYDPQGKITDLLVEIDDVKIGVSVTRAYRGPNNPYSLDAAQDLLADKLADILVSSANVVDEDRWTKQILHVVAYAPDYADFIVQAWEDMDDPDLASVRADTIVIVTVTDGADGFAY